jgi:DNA repair ATPase RecN
MNVDYTTIFSGVVLAVVAYFLGMKKQQSETDLNEIQATEKAIAIWRQLAQDFKKEVDELRQLVQELQAEIEQLKSK